MASAIARSLNYSWRIVCSAGKIFLHCRPFCSSPLLPPPASQQLQAQGARSPLGEANMEHDPINAIPVSHHMPQHGQRDHPESNRLTATWSQLPAHSAQVLHARLSACALLPEHTATGQQLLEIELQIQSILGVRKAERGEDADNVCWVDNGLLLCPEGVKSFAIAYGDAECAQVFTLLHAQMPNTQE